MPYVYEVKRHDCDLPDSNEASNTYRMGTLWQCDECGELYELISDQRDGWIWMKKGKYTVPFKGEKHV